MARNGITTEELADGIRLRFPGVTFFVGDDSISGPGGQVRYRPEDRFMLLSDFLDRIVAPIAEATTNVALKNDTEKDPWHLAPWDAFRAVVKVMAFGARKYKGRNWELGFDWHRLHRAAIEHLTSWWMGEDKDPETGYSHLWHAGCCVMFLIAHEMRGIGKDDRPHKMGD